MLQAQYANSQTIQTASCPTDSDLWSSPSRHSPPCHSKSRIVGVLLQHTSSLACRQLEIRWQKPIFSYSASTGKSFVNLYICKASAFFRSIRASYVSSFQRRLGQEKGADRGASAKSGLRLKENGTVVATGQECVRKR